MEGINKLSGSLLTSRLASKSTKLRRVTVDSVFLICNMSMFVGFGLTFHPPKGLEQPFPEAVGFHFVQFYHSSGQKYYFYILYVQIIMQKKCNI